MRPDPIPDRPKSADTSSLDVDLEFVSAPRNWAEYYLRLFGIWTVDGCKEALRAAGCRRTGFCDSKRRLDGLTAVVTGANSGIGFFTAEDLWARGADVVLACRDPTEGQAALEDMRARSRGQDRPGAMSVLSLDLSSLESVRGFAGQLLASTPRIHILVNNAGVMMPPFGLSEDGYELQFAVNHLGHFLLTLLLLPRMVESQPARVVVLSSLGHSYYKQLDLEIMNDPKRYFPTHAYCRSKAANVMFALELAKRLEGSGVHVYAVNPGYVGTRLYRYGNEGMFRGFRWLCENVFFKLFKTPWEGSQTSIHCAVCESVQHQTGLYYEDCRPAEVAPYCRDDAACRDLWERSLLWVGLPPDFDPFTGGSPRQTSALSQL